MAADAPPQRLVLFLQSNELQRVVERQQQLVGRYRLLEEINGAEPRGAHGHVDGGLPRNHDDRRGDAEVAQLRQHCQTVFSRHHDIREHDVEALGAEQGERARGGVADDRLVAGETEGARDRRQRRLIVVDNQDAAHAGRSRGRSR